MNLRNILYFTLYIYIYNFYLYIYRERLNYTGLEKYKENQKCYFFFFCSTKGSIFNLFPNENSSLGEQPSSISCNKNSLHYAFANYYVIHITPCLHSTTLEFVMLFAWRTAPGSTVITSCPAFRGLLAVVCWLYYSSTWRIGLVLGWQ